MRLLEGTIGTPPGNVVLHTTTFRTTVDLGRPATRVKALLRGFHVGFAEEDHNLKHLAVDLDVGYGDDASHVEVVASVRLADRDPQADILMGPELIEARVHFTLLVE